MKILKIVTFWFRFTHSFSCYHAVLHENRWFSVAIPVTVIFRSLPSGRRNSLISVISFLYFSFQLFVWRHSSLFSFSWANSKVGGTSWVLLLMRTCYEKEGHSSFLCFLELSGKRPVTDAVFGGPVTLLFMCVRCFQARYVLYVHFLSKCDPSKCKRQSFGFNLSIVDKNAHQTGHKILHVESLFWTLQSHTSLFSTTPLPGGK